MQSSKEVLHEGLSLPAPGNKSGPLQPPGCRSAPLPAAVGASEPPRQAAGSRSRACTGQRGREGWPLQQQLLLLWLLLLWPLLPLPLLPLNPPEAACRPAQHLLPRLRLVHPQCLQPAQSLPRPAQPLLLQQGPQLRRCHTPLRWPHCDMCMLRTPSRLQSFHCSGTPAAAGAAAQSARRAHPRQPLPLLAAGCARCRMLSMPGRLAG